MKYLMLLLTSAFFQCNTSAQIPATIGQIESALDLDIQTIDSFELVVDTLFVGGVLDTNEPFVGKVFGQTTSEGWVIAALSDRTTGESCTSKDGCETCRFIDPGCSCLRAASWATKPWCEHKLTRD